MLLLSSGIRLSAGLFFLRLSLSSISLAASVGRALYVRGILPAGIYLFAACWTILEKYFSASKTSVTSLAAEKIFSV
jgi:hypothetical protein